MEIAKLYLPAFVSIGLFLLLFLIKNDGSATLTLKVPFIDATFPVKRIWGIRALILVMAVTSLSAYRMIDLSSLFPPKMEMQVFYDEVGIQAALAEFSEEDLKQLGKPTLSKDRRAFYYDELDRRLNEQLGGNVFFSLQDGIVHSEGETVIAVKKEEGFLKYVLKDASGKLEHILERPGEPDISFVSFFEMHDTQYNFMHPKLWDVIKNNGMLMQPRFKQIIAEDFTSRRVVFDHTLVGATKIRALPSLTFGNTVYFFVDDDGKLVPIAYAIYSY